MNKTILVIALVFFLVGAICVSDDDTEKAAVIKVIEDAYLNGINNVGDPEAIKKGFHEYFIMRGIRDGKLSWLGIAKWIEIIAKRKADGKYPPKVKTRFEYPLVDVTGTTAMVKIKVFRCLNQRNNIADKQIYTDYLLLLKFPDGWKITDKIYFQH